MRAVRQDPPSHVRWTSVRLAEPLVLRRPWWRPRLERLDGTPLSTDADGHQVAEAAAGRPVRVSAKFSLLQVSWVLHVDGRPVPATAAVSRSAGFGVWTAAFWLFVLGGAVSAALCYAVCLVTIAVRSCEGDRATRRRQARTVAVTAAAAGIAVVAVGALVTRPLLDGHPFLFGLLGAI